MLNSAHSVTPGIRRQIGTYAVLFIRGTLASSALPNAFTFCEGAGSGLVLHGIAFVRRIGASKVDW